ncbi:MAG TPA: pyridoxal phosphate-dependent aminotransferase [Polyangiaceae bacterium]|nr:pyridoxal phosphate-dependent aminotransferase [Polyangiaceae bacterium]
MVAAIDSQDQLKCLSLYRPWVRFSGRSHLDRRQNRLAAALSERAVVGRAHLDMTVSNPTRANVAYDHAALLTAVSRREALIYEPEPFGLGDARAVVAALWGERRVDVEPARVVLTASTSEAYSFLFKLLCDAGDAVLVPRPSYPLFEHLCRFEGVEAAPYHLRYDGAWHVDLESLRKARTGRTRAIVVVSPNNPTSSYLKRDELAALAELGLPIVSDEVFSAYAASNDPRRALSALEAGDALVFALDGLSKYAALPQMKLAWITVGGPRALAAEALGRLELVCDAFLSPSAVVQHALPELLRASAVSRDDIRRRLARNHAALLALSVDTPATALTYEGGWYAVVRLPAVRSEEAWVLGLLEDRDVLVQPGFFYDFDTEPFVVLSLLTEEAPFAEGVRRLTDYAAGA